MGIKVGNPKPMHEIRSGGSNTALKNIEHRLRALYGESVLFETRDEGDQFQVDIEFNPENLMSR